MVAVRTMAIDSDGCALGKPMRVRVDARATIVRREQRVGLSGGLVDDSCCSTLRLRWQRALFRRRHREVIRYERIRAFCAT
jgi:hypothetical protein